MGYKARNLKRLLDSKINVHHFQTISNLDELKEYRDNHPLFTMRFDSDEKIKDLPFYTYNNLEHPDSNDNYLEQIMKEALEYHCTLLCSDGYKYDQALKFNFVIERQDNYDFMMEICSLKVPLREMYQHKTTVIKGNLLTRKYTYINREDNTYTLDDISYVLDYVMDKPYSYFEGTLYETSVGFLKEVIAIWQTN